jgi:SAM-dependent methyltransferase
MAVATALMTAQIRLRGNERGPWVPSRTDGASGPTEGDDVDEIGEHNRQQFDASEVVADYVQMEGLTPCEQDLFDRRISAGTRILDLGVGAGRTTPWLLERGSSYVGIDYAPAMVDAARELHPDAEFQVGDAADLSDWDDQAFDVVVFSYNGIDYLDDDARSRCLAEIRRVLVPGGLYVFSTHNPRAIIAPPPPGGNVAKRMAASVLMTSRRARRLVTSAPFRSGEGWVLDPVRGGLRTHMAIPDQVRAELDAAGFETLEHRNGDQPRRPSSLRTPWWYYACRSRP